MRTKQHIVYYFSAANPCYSTSDPNTVTQGFFYACRRCIRHLHLSKPHSLISIRFTRHTETHTPKCCLRSMLWIYKIYVIYIVRIQTITAKVRYTEFCILDQHASKGYIVYIYTRSLSKIVNQVRGQFELIRFSFATKYTCVGRRCNFNSARIVVARARL